MSRWLAFVLTVGLILGVPAPGVSRADDWHVVRAVLVMRHGVRPPNQDPPVPTSIAPQAWPAWSTPPGWLTHHGAAAIRLVAADDARRFAADGLLPAQGCPPPGAVHVVSDSLQRTIATGDAYAAALAPGCALPNLHQPQGIPDPLFAEYRDSGITTEEAAQAVAAAVGPDGATALAARYQPALDTLTRILCGTRSSGCGLTGLPSGTEVDPTGAHRPKLTGALAHGSVISEVLELEYAEGKPRSEVGWGRTSAADIAAVGALHALELSIIARPRPLALANAGGIADTVARTLDDGPPVTVIVGHDTDVANLAGLLDLHWSVPGFADDEPAPGGGLLFEVVEDSAGHRLVRTSYRSQTLDQIRDLAAGPAQQAMTTPSGCPDGLCLVDVISAALTRR